MSVDVAEIRKIAAVQAGKRYLEERSSPVKLAAVDEVLLHKAGSADPELLGVAAALRPDNPLAAYEDLGGEYT
jgi:hypothetical protein